MSEERQHALLSASASHRWLHCTPCARLEETLPDKGSDYAAEGGLAHEIAELKVRKAFTEPMGAKSYNAKLKKLQDKSLYQEEMLRHTDTYLEYITEIVHRFKSPPYIAVEKKLDYSMYAPEGFGTGDCIIIAGNELFIIDFKYGKGVPVSAIDNTQMMLYALGAYWSYSMLYPIETVNVAIIQPRLDSISEWGIGIEELLHWGESIKPVAQMAFEGKGEYSSGDWCQFCRAKALCRARMTFNMDLEAYGQVLPPLITNAEVGQILQRAQDLKKWVSNLEDYALGQCVQGIDVPGWKAVEGRSNRAFTDVDKAFAEVKANGYDEALLYERKPITLTKVEELLGKKQFKEVLDGFVEKAPGKPTLAQASDKREAITRPLAADVFNDDNDNN